MSVYTDDAANAAADLAQAGASVTFTRTTLVDDPATGTTTPTTTTATSFAIATKTNWQKLAALALVIQTPVTLKVAASGMAFAPQPLDTFAWGGDTYTVKLVDTLDVDGVTPLLYTVVGGR